MGYRRPLLQPVFTGDLEGLEVKARRMNLEQMFVLVSLGEFDMDNQVKTNQLWEDACRILSELIVTWNYEDDNGEPVQPTFENLCGMDFEFVIDVVSGLRKQATEADPELGKDSADSATSVEASLTMVPLSEHQAS